jgi:hypothetical protein
MHLRLVPVAQGAPAALLPCVGRSSSGGGGRGIHGAGEAFFGAGVVLGGGKWSVEGIEEATFKGGGRRQSVKSQRGNRSVGAVLPQ